MRLETVLVLAILLLVVVVGDPAKHFKIGGIFSSNDYESQLAFQTAIDRINQISRAVKFAPEVRIVSEMEFADSFRAEKLACELLSNGVVAIFGPDSVDSRGIVQSICETFEIPHIGTMWSPFYDETVENEVTVNFYPDDTMLARALAALVEDFDWKSYAVLYEDDEGLVRLQEVLKKRVPSSHSIAVHQLDPTPNSDNRPIFKAIAGSAEKRIILDCRPENILSYFQQASQVKLTGDYQNYILTSLDAHMVNLSQYSFIRSNITSIRMVQPETYETRSAVFHWISVDKVKAREFRFDNIHLDMALMNDAVLHFGISFIDLDETENITTPEIDCKSTDTWKHGLSVASFMRLKTTTGMTGIVKFSEKSRNDFALDVLELNPKGYSKIAAWNPNNRMIYTRSTDEMKKLLAEKWQSKTFIVSSKLGSPYLMERKAKEGEILIGNARYEGYTLDLIDAIAKEMNITHEFKLVPDEKYGGFNSTTKKWDGLIGELLEGRADLAICDLTITSERKNAVDFTMPFMTLGIGIIFSKPTKEPPKLFSFMSPLSFNVWVYMGTAYLGVSLLLFILARMAPASWENPRPGMKDPEELVNIWQLRNTFWFSMGSLMGAGCDILPKMAPNEWANPHPCDSEPEELENALTLLNTMWLSMGSFLQQGSDILPRAVSTRMVAGMWWFFTLIMISSYTANLAAFLTNDRMDSDIKNADDLAKQTKVQYGTVHGGSTSKFFQNSNFSTYKRMWAAMESARPSVFVKSNNKGVERVLKGKGRYAFIMESTSIEYEMARDCNLTQIGGQLDSKGYGIAMPPDSPYRTEISKTVLKLQESGKLLSLKNKWWKEQYIGTPCSDDSNSSDDSTAELGIDNVGGVFVVLGCGCAMAFLVAVTEFLWNVRKVAVEEKIHFSEAFVNEFKFAINLSIVTKPVTTKISESSSSSTTRSSRSKSPGGGDRGESRSIAGNMLHAATSFMRLDKGF